MSGEKKISINAIREYADHACFIDSEARDLLLRCAEEIETLRKKLDEADDRIEELERMVISRRQGHEPSL